MITRGVAGSLAIAMLALLSTSCASRDYRRQDFARDRDRCVGLTFGDSRSWWCGWQYAVSQREGDDDTGEREIAPPDMGTCRWTYSVDRASHVVTGWRYAAGEQDCYTRIDWLGPW